MPTQPKSRIGTYTLTFLVAIIVAGTALYFFYASLTQEEPVDTLAQFDQAQSLVLRGSYDQAIDSVRSTSAGNEDPNVQIAAERIEAYSRFMSGQTEEQLAAVRLTKETYEKDLAAGNLRRQSRDISRLLEFVTASRDMKVFDEVFSGRFAAYEVEGDFNASMAKLAEYAFSLYPTTIAYFTTSLPDLSPLTNFDKIYNISAAEKKVHADALLKLLASAEEVYKAEPILPGTTDVMAPARYYYWMGLIYGAVATVYPEYLDESEAALGEIFKYYESERDASGARYPLVESRLPMADYIWASTLLRVKGTEREADIKKHLDSIITRVTANPANFDNQFIPLIKKMVIGNAISQRESFLALAKVHQPFADFLAGYGLTADE